MLDYGKWPEIEWFGTKEWIECLRILAHCSTNEELHYYSKPATSAAAQGNSKMTQPKYLLTSSPQQIQRSLSRRLLQMVVGSVPPMHPPHLQAIRCTASVDPHLSAQHLHAVPSHLPGIRQWNQWVKNGSNGPKQPFLVANPFESFDPCLNLPKPKHWMDPTCAWRPQASSPVLRPGGSAVASPSLVNQTPRPGNGRYTLSVELEVCTSKLEGFHKICRFLGQKRHFRTFISKDKWWKPCWRLRFWPAVRTNCLPTSPVTSSERRRSSVRVAVM